MSVRTPIFTTPSETFPLAWASAPEAARVMNVQTATRAMRSMRFPFSWSHAQEAMQRLQPSFHICLPDDVDDAPPLDEEVPVGEGRDEAEVLLDEDDREPALLQGAHDLPERLHDHGREALGDLVEEEQARAGAEDAGHGEHLL